MLPLSSGMDSTRESFQDIQRLLMKVVGGVSELTGGKGSAISQEVMGISDQLVSLEKAVNSQARSRQNHLEELIRDRKSVV